MANSLTIFYSWQNDAPPSLNRGFIEKALHEALKRLHLDAILENALRDNTAAEPDHDPLGIGASPSITETILRKIDECAVFVADLTFVGLPKGALTNVTSGARHFPNPNVLIEYGYALRTHTQDKLIGIMNTAYGRPEGGALPFDLRQLCSPITYHLSNPGASDKHGQLENLVQMLTKALGAIVPEPSFDFR